MLLQAARAYFLANSGHINLLDAEKKRINYSEKCWSINHIKTRLSIFHYLQYDQRVNHPQDFNNCPTLPYYICAQI